MVNKLALSTAFLIPDCHFGEDLVNQSISLGFSALELNIEVTEKMVTDIKRAVEEKKIEIVSLHNFCPKLDFIPAGRDLLDAYQFSSPDPEERKKAIELTKRTIDYAADLEAKAVVIHAGEVEIESDEGKLFWQFARGKISRDYLERVKKEREKKEKIYLENSLKSIEELVNYAQKKKVKIGLENRFFYHEIPNFEEIGLFLSNFGDGLSYWHDTGHAEVSAKLGFVPNHEEYLKIYGSQIIGIHLHDIKGFNDHLAPGTGEIDFTFLARYINSSSPVRFGVIGPVEVIKAVEAHRCSTISEVKASISYLKKVNIV